MMLLRGKKDTGSNWLKKAREVTAMEGLKEADEIWALMATLLVK